MIALLLILLAIVLPGYLLARRICPASNALASVSIGATLGLACVPTMAYVLVWQTQTPITLTTVLCCAALLALISLPWRGQLLPEGIKDTLPAFAVLLTAAGVLLNFTEMRATDQLEVFEPCLHQSSLYLQQHDSRGVTLHDPYTNTTVTHVLSHPTHPGFGMTTMLHYQRPANSAVFATFMVLAGSLTVELLAGFIFFLVGALATVTAANVTPSRWASLCAGLATLVATHGIAAYMVNESTFALVTGLAILCLLTRNNKPIHLWFVMGALAGFGYGVRITAAIWVLAIVLAVLREKRKLLAAISFLGATILFAAPWLWTYASLVGDPFFYPAPAQSEITHSFLGIQFIFRPLNWPFAETLFCNTHNPLPPLLWLPLQWLQSMGGLIAAASVTGMYLVARNRPQLRWVLVVWSAPIMLFMMALAYLDYEKLSWSLVAAPPLCVAFAAFFDALVSKQSRSKVTKTWVVGVLVSFLLPAAISLGDYPRDERIYRRIGPDIEPPPATMAERRAALTLPAIFPSTHHVEHPSKFWSHLRRTETPPFTSGQIVAWQAHEEPFHVKFPVLASHTPPDLPNVFNVNSFEEAEIHEGTFILALKLQVSERAEIDLFEEEHVFAIQIDPGPKPHTERYVAFVVKDYVSERFKGITVNLGDASVPVTLSGYDVLRPGDAEAVQDLKLVANYDALKPAEATFSRTYADDERQYTYWRKP